MSVIKSSAPGASPAEALCFTVHSPPLPELADDRRTRHGRLKMLLVLLVCAAPVIASYLTYFVIRPSGRTNYAELVNPSRPMPADLPLLGLDGHTAAATSLKGQWLYVVVAGGACDARCERALLLQRQLRESLGRDKDRIDKVWLIDDDAPLRAELLKAIEIGDPVTVLRVPRQALSQWLLPPAGQALEEPAYLIDPMGDWMMRAPADPDPAKLKRDIERLLRASAGWDHAGR